MKCIVASVEKPEIRRPLGTSRRWCYDNIEIDVRQNDGKVWNGFM